MTQWLAEETVFDKLFFGFLNFFFLLSYCFGGGGLGEISAQRRI